MVKVKITIDAHSGDPYVRYHGKAVDEDLPEKFWVTDPSKKIGIAWRKFHHEQTVDLRPGVHTVTYGVSSPCRDPYFWQTTIKVNDKVVAQGKVCGGQYLTGRFLLGFLVPVVIPVPKVVAKVFRVKLFKP